MMIELYFITEVHIDQVFLKSEKFDATVVHSGTIHNISVEGAAALRGTSNRLFGLLNNLMSALQFTAIQKQLLEIRKTEKDCWKHPACFR